MYLSVNPVKQTLLQLFSAGNLRDGQRGFFHPDQLTLGQPLYLSQIIAKAVKVPGVVWVEPTRFQRWGRPSDLQTGKINIGPFEIARVNNDPNAPQKGRIVFDYETL